MRETEINIKNRMLQFVATIVASILLTVGYLVWMTHQTYAAHHVIRQELIPNVKSLNELRSDILTLVSDVRECIRTEDPRLHTRLLQDIQAHQYALKDHIQRYSDSVRHDRQRHALALKTAHHFEQLSQEISYLLQLRPAELSTPVVLTQFSPVFKTGKSTVMSIDASLALNLQHTEQAFSTIESSEVWNIAFYMACIGLLMGMIYLAGRKTYQRIIHLLGAEPKAFIPLLHHLLEGEAVTLDHVHEKSLIAQLAQSLLWDKETGVPNKLGFLHYYPQHVHNDQPVTAILIKLQGLEELTDFIGVQSAQQLLAELVSRLQGALPTGNLLSRVSSSSFLWIIQHRVDDDTLIKQLQAQLAHIQAPYNLGIRQLKLKVFAGIVNSDAYIYHYKQLIPYATMAAAKAESSLQPFVVFSPALLQASLDYIETETALSHAIANQEFEIYLQPQVEIATRKVCGAEALLRWKTADKGFIPPDQFIPIAERNGQILEIGDWILDQCIQIATEINRQAETLIPIAINLSSYQIQAPHFFESLFHTLTTYQCDPAWIKLEITESVLLGKDDAVLNTLLQIAALGIPISLDDFGTGYSSLSYLTKYPISQIKIDRSFMSDIPLQLDSTELVKAIFQLAEILHFEVVAEGIETLEQLNFLKQTSCKLVQGYYFFKPMPYDSFKKHVMVNPLIEEIVS